MSAIKVMVDRRHIAYRAPFSVEVFKSGFVIGVDAGGHNCVRFPDMPLAIGCDSAAFMRRAVDALNQQLPTDDIICAEIDCDP